MKVIASFCFAMLVISSVASAQVQKYGVVAHPDTEVTYTAKTPLMTIVGKTGAVYGSLELDPRRLASKSSRGHFEVSVATLSTGISYRDEVLRKDKWLDARRHPFAVFEITRVLSVKGPGKQKASFAPGKNIRVKAVGTLSIRGHQEPMEMEVTVTAHKPTPATAKHGITRNYLVIRGAFDVNFARFGIGKNPIAAWANSVPSGVRVEVNLVAVHR